MDDLRKQSDTACVYESILNLHAIFEITGPLPIWHWNLMVTLEILHGVSNQTPLDREVIWPSQVPVLIAY
jgi:hypothetical protein